MFMSKFLLIIIVLLITAFPSYSQTQAGMNKEAAAAYKNTDKKLNDVYQKIIKLYSANDLFIKNLKAAQRIWLQYRDAQIELRYPKENEDYYGSSLPMCKLNYSAELTNVRAKELEEWIKEPAEGEICNGTVGEFKPAN
jgi:uncharacterized protein YecT (DUF1311 family)